MQNEGQTILYSTILFSSAIIILIFIELYFAILMEDKQKKPLITLSYQLHTSCMHHVNPFFWLYTAIIFGPWQVSGKPIKLVGRGERLADLEPFYPDRMAGRILGMGDVLSFVEKAQEVVSSSSLLFFFYFLLVK